MIELLVVIAVIAILAGLLLPALSKAKARSQQTACLNKLKQWSLATRMYADDNEDSLPREKASPVIHTWADVTAASSSDVWFNALPPTYFGEKGANGYAFDPDGFHASKGLFQCPSARLPMGNAGPLFSLAFNSKLNQSKDVFAVLKFQCIQNEAATVLFLDSGLPGEQKLYASQKDYDGQPSAWAVRLSGRHNRGANLAFADGHLQWFRGFQLVDPATGASNTNNADVRWICP